MSKPKFKVDKSFSYKKLANQLPDIIADGLNEKAKWINKGIQDNLDAGVDIDGNPHTELSDTTIKIRESRGHKSGPPLVASGKMRNTRKIKEAKSGNLVATIIAITPYGKEHNEGLNGMPQRKWFGITKDNRPGGEYSKKVDTFLTDKIRRGWKK